jgi:hypothetical protein
MNESIMTVNGQQMTNQFGAIDAQDELASLIRISPEETVNEMD